MRVVVTGAAGFIGSTLANLLVATGHEVVALDCLTPYYDIEVKRANARGLDIAEDDLRSDDLREHFAGADVVFHLAAQPGVRASWNEGFAACESHNVLATQRVLEAVADARVPRVVVASSSSVYGEAGGVVDESSLLAPRSPYGVTKVAAEHLCRAYALERSVHPVLLRLFTVYGPRQRPDMAIHRLIASALGGGSFPLYGDGGQRRDFTYVDDVVRAMCDAAHADVEPGAAYNIAGGSTASIDDLVEMVAAAAGSRPDIRRLAPQAGDVRSTEASIDRAHRDLAWEPRVGLEDGVAAQVGWQARR